MNITSTLHSTAFHQPLHAALVDDSVTMDYASLSVAVNHFGQQLAGLGIREGMGVGVMGTNSMYFVIMAYAVMETGAVVMPVSAQISADELREIMNISGFHALLHDGTGPAYTSGRTAGIETPDKPWTLVIRESDNLARVVATQIPNPAFARFTSGTTGASKGVLLSHGTIEARTRAANEALKLGPDDTVLWVLPMAYHFVVSIMLYLRYGCTVVLNNNFLASGLLESIERHNVTFIYTSPMHIRLLSADASGKNMKQVRMVISTSTSITAEQCEKFRDRFSIPVTQAYGIIEVGLPVINLESASTDPQAIGHAVPAYKVEIVDDAGKPVPPGTIGNLVMRGPGMFDAYLFPYQSRHEIMRGGWFYTGDLASKDAKGLIRIEGRMKSMINVAGNKVFPEEVEAVLNRHPSVSASRVTGFQHPLLGECVQAELVLLPGTDAPDFETLGKFCRDHLSPYKVPQRFSIVQVLPETPSGKIKRR